MASVFYASMSRMLRTICFLVVPSQEAFGKKYWPHQRGGKLDRGLKWTNQRLKDTLEHCLVYIRLSRMEKMNSRIYKQISASSL